MKAIIFGATGMVGQGVVQVCLEHPDVEKVLLIGRTSAGLSHAKVTEILQRDMYAYSNIASELAGYDACFFCLGISSLGMSEADYTHVTYDLTLAAAQALVKVNPQMTFCFVSGQSTDSTEKGPTMWARVKGKTENALQSLPFKAVYCFRPGFIQPMKGVKSKTFAYRAIYAVMSPLYPMLKGMAPGFVTNNEAIGQAMIQVVKEGYSTPVLETRDINAAAEGRKQVA